MDWQPIATAPKDGTKIWGWLYDTGILPLRWMTEQENADEVGDSDNADDYRACWVQVGQTDEVWYPKFWLPFDAIPAPPGVVLVNDGFSGKWRDVEAQQ